MTSSPPTAASTTPSAAAAALSEADFAPLLMSYVQLTGDTQALDDYARYIQGPWNYMECVPPEEKAWLRARLTQVLAELASGERAMPAAPSGELLQRMLSVCVGQPVPADYVPLICHEMGFAGAAPLDVTWRKRPAPEVLNAFRVLVIGAGESGIGAGIKLKAMGIPFVIIEKSAGVGGTWRDNKYPGCGVDTPNHFYQFSFEPNPDWSRHFALSDEVQQYLEHCAVKYELMPHIRFGSEVLAARYDAASATWNVTTRQGGCDEDSRYNAVICAVGQLNQPFVPLIDGLADFTGPQFHTARWDASVDLAGRRVAMIGTGASGMQTGPSIADRVAQLTIFQRSPHWAVHNPNYHASVPAGKKWALRHLPHYAQWTRFQLFWASADGVYESLKADPDWPQAALSLNATNHAFRERLIEHITRETGGDPALLAKTIPSYPPYGKRMLRDNHWYRTLTRANVELVTDAIDHVGADAVVTRDGRTHRADVLILATGFQARRMTWPIEIAGVGGRTLSSLWGEDDPRAYLGITVPGFPNFFLMYGPNTNLAHGGSAIFHSECQVRYALLALRELLETGAAALDCSQDVHDAFNERVDALHAGLVWSHPGVGSWYKNQRGRVFATSPWRLLDYWNMTRTLDPADYHFTMPGAGAARA